MASLNKKSRNFTVSLLTSIILLALLLFYILEHIPNNESRINARNFRVLARMGLNLKGTIQSYQNYVVPTFAHFTLAHHSVDQPNERNSLKGKNQAPVELTSQKALSKIILENASKKKIRSRFRLEYDAEQNFNSGLFHLKDRHLHFFVKVDTAMLGKRWKMPSDSMFLFQAKISIDSLLPPLHRKDIFEHLLVIKTQKTKDDEKMTGRLIYTSSPFHPSFFHVDSLVRSPNGLFGGKVMDVELAGEPYKLYLLGQEVGPEDKWILAGAVPLKHFRTELLAIDSSLVVFILLALAILVLALPFIKLMLMNEQERLQKRDVILASLALFVGVSLTVILLFDTYVYLGPGSLTKRTQLEGLSTGVAKVLSEEIRLAIEQLTELDNLPTKRENILFLNSKNAKWEKSGKSDSLPLLTKYPDMIRVFWADTAGIRLNTWTKKGENHEIVSVANREYFRALQEGKGWVHPTTKEPFYLQSILSWIDGEKYAIISKESRILKATDKKTSVIALTTKLTSLTKPSLPPGYGFFVVNQEGEVLFHKDENLNLNENLLEESGFNPSLQAALFGFTPTHFEEHYQGSMHQLFIQPMPDLPLFLVTYVDHDYQSAAKVNIVSLATALLLFYFLMHALLVGLPLLTTASQTKLKYHRLSFQWLWPQKTNQRVEAYWRVAAALIYAIVVVIWMTDRDWPVASFFIMLLTLNFTFSFAYVTIRNIDLKNLFKDKSRWVLYISAAIAFILTVTCSLVYEGFGRVLAFQGVLAVGLVALYILPLPSFPHRIARHYQRAHIIMVLAWLILTSALPSFYVFRIAYDYEAELMVRYHQLHLAQEISKKRHQQKTKPLKEVYEETTYLADNTNTRGWRIYADFFHYTLEGTQAQSLISFSAPSSQQATIKVVDLSHIFPIPGGSQEGNNWLRKGAGKDQAEERLLFNFIHAVRPVFNNVLTSETFLKNSLSDRAKWKIWPQRELLELKYTNPSDPECSVHLVSQLPLYRLPTFTFSGDNSKQVLLSGGFFWLEVLLLVVFLFFMISFLINRLFNLNFLSKLKMGTVDKELLHHNLKNKVLLIALPGAPGLLENQGQQAANFGKSPTESRQAALGNTVKVREIDLSIHEKTSPFSRLNLREEEKVVLVKNFDHEPYDENWIQQKLELLGYLEGLTSKKIILVSAEHPSQWEEHAKSALRSGVKEAPAAAKQEKVLKLIQLLLHRLNGFTKVYQPLQRMELQEEPTLEGEGASLNETFLLKAVNDECSSCDHLVQYKERLYSYIRENNKEKNLTKVDIILKIQSLAHLYYRALWAKCSEEEHYMLFDLAQDGLVNARNVGVLSSLLSKGLLIREQNLNLRLFNDSFRNFVLTVVDKEEALRFEKKAAQGSSWETYRTPLFMVLAGAMLFIFYTQKDTWTMMLAVLTAFSTVVGILPRLGFLIPAFLAKSEGK